MLWTPNRPSPSLAKMLLLPRNYTQHRAPQVFSGKLSSFDHNWPRKHTSPSFASANSRNPQTKPANYVRRRMKTPYISLPNVLNSRAIAKCSSTPFTNWAPHVKHSHLSRATPWPSHRQSYFLALSWQALITCMPSSLQPCRTYIMSTPLVLSSCLHVVPVTHNTCIYPFDHTCTFMYKYLPMTSLQLPESCWSPKRAEEEETEEEVQLHCPLFTYY